MSEEARAAENLGFQDGMADAEAGNRDCLDTMNSVMGEWEIEWQDAYLAAYARGLGE